MKMKMSELSILEIIEVIRELRMIDDTEGNNSPGLISLIVKAQNELERRLKE